MVWSKKGSGVPISAEDLSNVSKEDLETLRAHRESIKKMGVQTRQNGQADKSRRKIDEALAEN